LNAKPAGRLGPLTRAIQTWRSLPDPLDRLTPFGWRGGVVFILAFSLLSFLITGYFLVYWRNADMDFMVVYSALALNDGGRSAFFDHPAYLTILSVKAWLRLLHQIHLLDAWTLSRIPPASDGPAFDAAMTSAIRAGRIVALLTAGGLFCAFTALARRIVGDRRIATCGVFAFALSGGVQMHLRILRSEMIAALFCILALMLLIVVARRGTVWRPLAVAVAAWLCVLGLENKVQAILLIAALPMLVLPFGTATSASAAFWRAGSGAALAAAAAAVAAACAAMLAWPLIATGLDPAVAAAAGLKPFILGRFGIYQALLAGWIVACMIAFAAIWRVSPLETSAAIAALVLGASLGLLLLDIQYDVTDVAIVLNPIEKMSMYVETSDAAGSLADTFRLALAGLVGALARYSFVLMSSPRPAVFLTWLIFPGIVYVWRRDRHQAAAQAALLMLAAVAIDAIGVRRGLKIEYFVFTDPLIILAGMILLDAVKDVRFHRWAFPIGAALIVLHVAIGQAEPVKLALKRNGPQSICEWSPTYMPALRLPWCERI
jgi:hypothetical protein